MLVKIENDLIITASTYIIFSHHNNHIDYVRSLPAFFDQALLPALLV